jgi:general secretion pathway protein G
MDFSRPSRSGGFSLVELVIVIVIISAIAAIAVPRLTRGANNAGAAALKADLAVLRNAIELYRAEHEGKFPDASSIAEQLTYYTDVLGVSTSSTADVASGIVYGPYLKSVPASPVGTYKGQTGISATSASSVGWIYDEDTGSITANAENADTDQDGTKYDTY